MKYLILIFTTLISLITLSGNIILAQDSEYGFPFDIDESKNIQTIMKDDIVEPGEGFFQRILEAFKIKSSGDQPIIDFVVNIINILLGLVTLVALIVLIYGFGQIFFAKTEEGLTRAKKIVINTFIAIVIIALSRLIVSFIMYLYKMITTG